GSVDGLNPLPVSGRAHATPLAAQRQTTVPTFVLFAINVPPAGPGEKTLNWVTRSELNGSTRTSISRPLEVRIPPKMVPAIAGLGQRSNPRRGTAMMVRIAL